MTHPDLDLDLARRGLLLKGGGDAVAAVAAAFAGPISALAARVDHAAGCAAATASALLDSPYGATAPVNDLTTCLPLIDLPPGFSDKSHGWRGDAMADGRAAAARPGNRAAA